MNQKSKILFINPLVDPSYYKWEMRLGSRLPPLGLCSLAAYTRGHGFPTRILDAYNLGLNLDETLKEIATFSPDYVGITATTSYVHFAASLAESIKNKFPEIITIIGGSHLSAAPEETMLKFPWFDVGIIGEGEETIIELLNRLSQPKDLGNIYGIIYRDGKGLKRTQNRPYIDNLDRLPFPALDLIPNFPHFYRPTPTNYKRQPVASLVTSRGCPYNCTFCDRSVFGNRYRSFSPNYVVALIKDLKQRFGVREICFYDDTFTVNKVRLQRICDLLQEDNLNISWSCLGRVDLTDRQTLRLMKRSGCWLISYGIESASEEILDLYKKQIDLFQVEGAIRLTREAGIRTRGFFMIGNPLETKATLKTMEKFILKIPLDEIHISFFTPLPGSESYDFAKKFGRFDKEWKAMDVYSPNFLPCGWDKSALLSYRSRLYKKFYFRPWILVYYFKNFFDFQRVAEIIKKGLSFFRLLVTDV